MKIIIMGYGVGKSYKQAYELCQLPDAVMLTRDKRHRGWIHNTITKMEESGLITGEAANSAKIRVKVYGDNLAGTSFRQVLIDDLDLNCPPEDKCPR